MKRLLTTAFALLIGTGASLWAQNEILDAATQAAEQISRSEDIKAKAAKPDYWTRSIQTTLGLTNTQLTNWAAGGYNTVTIDSSIDGKAVYSKDLASWNNRLQLDYGFLYSEDKKGLLQQNKDRIYLESKVAYKTGKNSPVDYTASFDFRSQFANGYKYNTPGEGQSWKEAATLKSGAFAPAYANIALGIDYKPKNWLTVNIAPLTGGLTLCSIESLRKTYGMHLKDEDLDASVGSNYHSALLQLGAQVKVDFKAQFNDMLKYETQLVLFSDYLDKPQNQRVNWDNQINWKLAKYFSVAFKTWLIYDPRVMIADDRHPDGRPMVQFKEYFTFNFTYTFKPKSR